MGYGISDAIFLYFTFTTQRVSFYHDEDHSASLSVTAELQNDGEIKRTLVSKLDTGIIIVIMKGIALEKDQVRNRFDLV